MLDHAPSPSRLAAVAAALQRIDLTMADPAAAAAHGEALRLVGDYLLPRVTHPGDDLVVAVVGVSGSGKSTLLNSLARRRVSGSGSRRPTTIEPVAWGAGALPATLDGARRRLPGRVVDSLIPPPHGLVLVDSPPPDVFGPEGRSICHDLVDLADVCVLVAAANRYADAAGFDLAHRAVRRGMPTVIVLNRLPASPELQRVLLGDFAFKLSRSGILDDPDPSRVVGVAEGLISAERDGLASEAVLTLRKELERLGDDSNRDRVIGATVPATTRRAAYLLQEVRTGVLSAAVRRAALADVVRLAFGAAGDQVDAAVGAGEFAGLAAHPEALGAALAAAAARRAGRAALRSAERWQGLEGGADPGLFTHDDSTPAIARERFEWWQSDVPRIATELSGKRVRPRDAAHLIAAVRHAVFDPAHIPDRRERRVLRRHPGVAAVARDRLADELAGIVATDSARFTARLGPPLPAGVFAALDLGEES